MNIPKLNSQCVDVDEQKKEFANLGRLLRHRIIAACDVSECSANFTFEDGSKLEITSDGGFGYNEGLSWLRYEFTEIPITNANPS